MTKTARGATETEASMKNRALLACALAALGATLGCGRHPVEVASVIDDGGTDAEIPCGPDAAACPANFRCAGSCDDPTTGTCEPTPASSTCTGPYAPVCDCNGLTYFNDCLRQAAQANLGATGQCGQRITSCEGGSLPCLEAPGPKSCDPTGSCGDADGGESCAFLLPFPVPVPAAEESIFCGVLSIIPRVCWVLPEACPMSDPTSFTNCGNERYGPFTPCAALKLGGASFLGSVPN